MLHVKYTLLLVWIYQCNCYCYKYFKLQFYFYFNISGESYFITHLKLFSLCCAKHIRSLEKFIAGSNSCLSETNVFRKKRDLLRN